jgi:hypothetical protein
MSQQEISGVILALVNRGVPVSAAVDAVLGHGAYNKLAKDIWTAARAA